MVATNEPPTHQLESKPNPDPTIATNDAVERAMKSERDYANGEIKVLIARMDGSDKAAALRLAAMDHMPALIAAEVGHLGTLIDSKLDSLEKRTAEQKADTTKALTDALAAQKEAVANQTASSEKSITKSETATTERIKGVEALLGTQSKATDDKISDLKERIIAIESAKLGGTQERIEHRSLASYSQNSVAWALGIIVTLITIAGFVALALKP